MLVLVVCSIRIEREPVQPPCFTAEARELLEAHPEGPNGCRLPSDLLNPISDYSLGYRLSLSQRAWAGESYLGTIFVTDGGTANNANCTIPDAGRDFDGGLITDGGATQTRYVSCGFPIPDHQKISLQDQNHDAFVGTGVQGCDAGRCLRLGASMLLPSSTGARVIVDVVTAQTNLLADGGVNYVSSTYNGGLVAVAPTDGGCCSALDVYLRDGNE